MPNVLRLTADIIHRIGRFGNPFIFAVRLLCLFPGEPGSFRPFSLGPQLGGFGKPCVFLALQLQPDLVRLELFRISGGFIHQNAALLPPHGRFYVPLALRGFIPGVVPPFVHNAIFVGRAHLLQLSGAVLRGASHDDGVGRVPAVQRAYTSPQAVVEPLICRIAV